MATQPVALPSASGPVLGTDNASLEGMQEISGLSFDGWTSVDLYDGDPATTGVLVAHCPSPNAYPFNDLIQFRHGVHVVLTGASGQGSVWVA